MNSVDGFVDPLRMKHTCLQIYLVSKNLHPVGLLCLAGLFVLSLLEQPRYD